MDGSRIQKEKAAGSKISGYVWTGPEALVEGDMATASGVFFVFNTSGHIAILAFSNFAE